MEVLKEGTTNHAKRLDCRCFMIIYELLSHRSPHPNGIGTTMVLLPLFFLAYWKHKKKLHTFHTYEIIIEQEKNSITLSSYISIKTLTTQLLAYA